VRAAEQAETVLAEEAAMTIAAVDADNQTTADNKQQSTTG